MTKRRLVLDRECVKALATELPHASLEAVRGGKRPLSLWLNTCTGRCETIDMAIDDATT